MIDSFSVTIGGNTIALPGTQAPRILALLALEAGRAVPHERIQSLLWPDGAPPTAHRQISNQLSALRSLVQKAGFHGLNTRNKICTLTGADTDLDRLDSSVSTARFLVRENRFDDALGLLKRCAASIPDEPISGLEGEPFRAETVRLLNLRSTLHRETASVLLEAGRHREAATAAAALFETDPISGTVVRILMESLHRSGDRAKALHHFEEHRRALSDRLGVDPDPETRRLHVQVLREEPRPATVTATPAFAVPPKELPAPPHIFVARDFEMDSLSAALRSVDDRPQVVSVNGAAGTGKSALAIHLAHREADRYHDGQVYLDLQGHTPGLDPLEPEDALRSVLRSLKVPVSDAAGKRELESRLRTATSSRRALLLLDNARDSAQARGLLPGSGGCGVIITSRRMLALPQVRAALRLDHLDTEQSGRLVGEYLGVEQATAHRNTLDGIVRACAGMPLALSIAAAKCRQTPAGMWGSYAARLAEEPSRLEALAIDDLSVRASVAASFEELQRAHGADAAAVRLFRTLGRFPATAVHANCVATALGSGPTEALTLLERLAEYELIARSGGGWYQVHGLVRDYAVSLTPRIERAAAPTHLRSPVFRLEHLRCSRWQAPHETSMSGP